jgi:hypothetical protein
VNFSGSERPNAAQGRSETAVAAQTVELQCPFALSLGDVTRF